jgi:hypothetical protein
MSSEIERALRLFFPNADDVYEVRVLNFGQHRLTLSGFSRGAWISAHASRIAEKTAATGDVYFTPHTLSPDVLRRCAGGPVNAGGTKLTHDEDVTARRYLLIDVDPVRPKGVCATDDEKAAAIAVANEVRGYLAGKLPNPLTVDSGNGVHLYYRLPEPLPGGPAAPDDPLADTLHTLAARFDTPAATIDRTVYEASQIMRLPGTWNRKGPNTPDRPHRQSAVIGGAA